MAPSFRVTASLLLIVASCTAEVPTQVHIAPAGRDGSSGLPTGATVSWFTSSSTSTSTVKFGTSPSSLTSVATGSASQYLKDAGYHHHVTISGLATNTQYYYICGDASSGFTDPVAFTSAKGPNDGPFTISMFGDLGTGKNGNAVETFASLARMYDSYDFVHHVGDISYADDAFTHDSASFEYENVYNSYMDSFSNVTASRKFYTVLPGNHESECHSPACLLDSTRRDSLNNFTAYNHRFAMPFESSGGSSDMWYSYNYGNAHIVAFDTETDFANAPEFSHGDSGVLPAGGFAPDGAQVKWLEADLAKANASRSTFPWLIVSGHRPIYGGTSNSAGFPSGDTANLQRAIEGLLIKYNVDLYVFGHVHSYARSFPVANNTVQTQSLGEYVDPIHPVHLLVGGAGCDEMKDKKLAYEGLPPWMAAKNTDAYGSGLLTIHNSTFLEWKWIASADGSVIDTFTLTKKAV